MTYLKEEKERKNHLLNIQTSVLFRMVIPVHVLDDLKVKITVYRCLTLGLTIIHGNQFLLFFCVPEYLVKTRVLHNSPINFITLGVIKYIWLWALDKLINLSGNRL